MCLLADKQPGGERKSKEKGAKAIYMDSFALHSTFDWRNKAEVWGKKK